MNDTVYRMNIPVSLALLGDMHGKPYQTVTNSLRKHHPEIITIAGDILYGGHPVDDRSPLIAQPYALPFLEGCSSIAPTFLSFGNHEWMLDAEDLEQIKTTGVIILDNSWVEWNGVVIGGLTSAYATEYHNYRETHEQTGIRYPKKVSHGSTSAPIPDVSWLQNFCAVSGYHILLSHHPEYYPLIPKDVQLILSAHAHGGQWRAFGRGFFAPGQGWWPKWTKGVYDERMVATAGLTNTAWAPRIFNPITNPGSVYSEPLITLTGSGDITLMVGTTIVELTDITTGIVLDCAMKEAYLGTILMNDHMSGDFPVLKPGLNSINWSGNVTSIVISPRWRYL